MTCADILPKITIKQITVTPHTDNIAPNRGLAATAGKSNEWYDLNIFHNNYIGVDDSALEDNFNLRDIYNATAGANPFYNIKLFLTNDINIYNFWIKNAAMVEAISLQDYNGEQTPTPSEVNAYVYGGKKGNPEVEGKVEEFKQCVFKLPKQETNKSKDDEDDSDDPDTRPAAGASFNSPAYAPTTWLAHPDSELYKCQKNLKCVVVEETATHDGVTTHVDFDYKYYATWQKAVKEDPVNWAKTHPWHHKLSADHPTTKCQKDLKCVMTEVVALTPVQYYYYDTPYEAFTALPSEWKNTHPQFSPPTSATSFAGSIFDPSTKPPPPKPKSLYERLLAAMLDNKVMDLNGPTDHVITDLLDLDVTPQKMVFNSKDGSYSFESTDFSSMGFGDIALKNLYLMMVPNVEYRVDEELIFTVRSFAIAKLVEDYQVYPQSTPLFTQEQIVIKLASPGEGDIAQHELAFGDTLEKIQAKLDEPSSLKSVIKPQAFVSKPLISFSRHDTLRGFFHLNITEILKNIIVYDWLLDGTLADQYQIVQSVNLYKNYENGERVKIPSLKRISNLSTEVMTTSASRFAAYTFTDEIEKRHFEYELEGYCLSPLYKIFQSLLYEDAGGNQSLPALMQQCNQLWTSITKMAAAFDVNTQRWLPKINPSTGYWTNEYLASALKVQDGQEYEAILTAYTTIVTNLAGKIPDLTLAGGFLAGPEAVDVLRTAIMDLALAVEDAAKKQGFKYTASPTTTKQGNQKSKGLVKYIKQISKPYNPPKTKIFYDFMLQEGADDLDSDFNIAGWEVDPNFLLDERYPIQVGSYNALYNEGSDVSKEKISPYVTAQSIVIENKRLNVVKESLPNTEAALEDVLIRAAWEKEVPELTVLNVQNPALKLLESQSTTIAENEDSFNFKETPSFDPLSSYAATPSGLVLFNQAIKLVIAKAKAEKKLKEELATGKFAVAILVEDADRARAKVDKFLDPKSRESNLWYSDDLAPQLKSAIESPQIFKTYPLSYMTHLLHLYTIEILSLFENDNVLTPIWQPLNIQTVTALKGTQSARLCRISGTQSIAAQEINNSFAILNQYFVLNDAMTAIGALALVSGMQDFIEVEAGGY